MQISRIVEDVLRVDPKARESDTELIIRVMMKMRVGLTPYQMDKIRDINFESVRRVRQKLQQNGKYLPSNRVAKQRQYKAMVIQQNMPVASVERTEQLLDQRVSLFGGKP